MRRAALAMLASLACLSGPVAVAADVPTTHRQIRAFAPDLWAREMGRAHVSWAHLRRMVGSRWRATHPAAEWARRKAYLVAHPTPEGNRELARRFFGPEYACAAKIIEGESGWRSDVWFGGRTGAWLSFPGSDYWAYGLGQARPRSKMLAYGRDAYTNPLTQLRWFRGYAVERYGSVCGAAAHWTAGGSW